jgi:hypothetical protein
MSIRADQVPEHWEDISPAWLTAALSARCAGAVVQQVGIERRDDGTNRRVVLRLRYSHGAGPETLFLKANDPAHRAVHLRNGNLFNEALLFGSEVSLPVEHPIVYKAIADQTQANFLLVMEDLTQRGADPRDALRPMTVEQVANGLRGLARLHSRYWGFSADSHPELGWVKTWEAGEGWLVGLRTRIPIGLQRASGLLPDSLPNYDGDQILEFWRRYVSSLSRYPMTLLHGDAHIGNTYIVPGGEVGFLDWQVVRRGEWSQDVGYFLVGALTEQDRRRHDRQLIQTYRDALDLPHAERPSLEQMWLRYRATPAYGLAIWLSTLGTDGWQAPAVSIALAQRYAAAFSELQSASVLAA